MSNSSKTAIRAMVWMAGIGSLSLSATLAAQEPDNRERAAISFGAFISNPRTEAQVSGDAGNGTDLNLEDDLGLQTSTTIARLDGHWWLSRRNRLDASVFSFSRDGSRTINKTINFGDQTFNINTVVTSQSDLDIWKAAYTFAPMIKDRGYLGVTAGLYVSRTTLSLSAPTAGRFESEDLTAPLPVIGLRGQYAVTDRIKLRGAYEWFGIDTGDVSGHLTDFNIGADYGFGKRFAVGLAYNDVTMNISADEGGSGFRGALDWGYDGWLIYMNVDIGGKAKK
jgi:hypothetical protein